MPGLHQLPNSAAAQGMAVIGIDVGGQRKGFHAVALTGGKYAGKYSTSDVSQLVDWCRQVESVVIAVDAPCRWSKDGRARPAERKLMGKRISCFSTPTRQRAIEHPKNHYGWMLRGEELFEALASSHPICADIPAPGENCCIETFPHAVTWHLTGGKANASNKRTQRRSLLTEAEIDIAKLTNIDLVDAAICALTAHCVASGGKYVSYGEADTGYIIVPAGLYHE
jgi:predicted nuclease with RNAse H fold